MWNMVRPLSVQQFAFVVTSFYLMSRVHVVAFSELQCQRGRPFASSTSKCSQLHDIKNNNEWTSDFDDYVGGDSESQSKDDDERFRFVNLVAPQQSMDLSACQSRLFSLGVDLILTDFVGNMGFDQVTDWEYYYEDEDNPSDRRVVNPNPFDKSKPKRTRSSSGSVVCILVVVTRLRERWIQTKGIRLFDNKIPRFGSFEVSGWGG